MAQNGYFTAENPGYSPFNKAETKERYDTAVRQLKEYPHNLDIQDEIKRYGSVLKYSAAKIEKDLGRSKNPIKFWVIDLDDNSVKATLSKEVTAEKLADDLNKKAKRVRYQVMGFGVENPKPKKKNQHEYTECVCGGLLYKLPKDRTWKHVSGSGQMKEAHRTRPMIPKRGKSIF